MFHPDIGARENYDQLLKRDPKTWSPSMANELGRLTNGVGTRMPGGNKNMVYIKNHKSLIVEKSHMQIQYVITAHSRTTNTERV